MNSPPAIAQPAGTTALAIELKGPEWGPGGELENDPTLSEVADAARRTAILLARLKAKPAAPAAVEPSSDPVAPVVTTVVTGDELKSLPVSGRQWQNFVLDAPTSATVAGGEAQTSLRGAGQEPIETTVDGASTRLAFGGQGSSESGSRTDADQGGMGQAWASGHGFAIAEAAIREVQTVAGNVATEGSRAGRRANECGDRTRRERAPWAGVHFDRQNTWGAQNPFTQWVKETAPATETTCRCSSAELLYAARTTRRSGAWARAARFARISSFGSPRSTLPAQRSRAGDGEASLPCAARSTCEPIHLMSRPDSLL